MRTACVARTRVHPRRRGGHQPGRGTGGEGPAARRRPAHHRRAVLCVPARPQPGPESRVHPHVHHPAAALQRRAELLAAGHPAQPAAGDQPLGGPGAAHRPGRRRRHRPADPRRDAGRRDGPGGRGRPAGPGRGPGHRPPGRPAAAADHPHRGRGTAQRRDRADPVHGGRGRGHQRRLLARRHGAAVRPGGGGRDRRRRRHRRGGPPAAPVRARSHRAQQPVAGHPVRRLSPRPGSARVRGPGRCRHRAHRRPRHPAPVLRGQPAADRGRVAAGRLPAGGLRFPADRPAASRGHPRPAALSRRHDPGRRVPHGRDRAAAAARLAYPDPVPAAGAAAAARRPGPRRPARGSARPRSS